jgi:hypothetical protein
MVFLLDGDLSGFDSVAHLLDTGQITRLPCRTYTEFITATRELALKVTPADLVIVDTVSKLAETLRDDILHGENQENTLAEISREIKGETYGRNCYQAAQRVFMRQMKNIHRAGDGARIITVFHEKDQKDPDDVTLMKRGPSVNAAFYDSIVGQSSDIFRLTVAVEDVLGQDGKVKYPRKTRFLQLQDSEEALAKYKVSPAVSEKLPRRIVNPTLPKLYKVLGKKPSWLSIYGSPGTGKSTLACSEIEIKEKI